MASTGNGKTAARWILGVVASLAAVSVGGASATFAWMVVEHDRALARVDPAQCNDHGRRLTTLETIVAKDIAYIKEAIGRLEGARHGGGP